MRTVQPDNIALAILKWAGVCALTLIVAYHLVHLAQSLWRALAT
jgi:hypothetical protein